jgi:hypothetical protein
LLHLAEHLRGRGLIETHLLHEAGFVDRLEDALRAEPHDVAGVFGDVE